MSEQSEIHAVVENLPHVSQDLRLTCGQCGKSAVYDVGAVFFDKGDKNKAIEHFYSFSNYFRCQQCGGPGPWKIANVLDTLRLGLKPSGESGESVRRGRYVLFDGTAIQTPAIGEDHLLSLIAKDPANAFLCTRLANLLRNCGQKLKAQPWYEKAVSLDPKDIEAQYELFGMAVQADENQAALGHARALIGCLLEGHKTENDKLNQDIALSIAEELRSAPEEFQQLLFAEVERRPDAKELVFIRNLSELEGDEKRIVQDAAERLLTGKSTPLDPAEVDDQNSMQVDLVSSLRTVVESAGLNPKKLTVALETNGEGRIRVQDRRSIPVTDGRKMARWYVPSLVDLFRGSQPPPANIDQYPPEYALHFFFIENHLLTVCDSMGDRPDQEMEEIYAALRRRPNGRSLGAIHDFLWQVAALLLGIHVVSAGEYEALFGQLARSVGKWALRPVSRNYAAYLRKTFVEARAEPSLLPYNLMGQALRHFNMPQ